MRYDGPIKDENRFCNALYVILALSLQTLVSIAVMVYMHQTGRLLLGFGSSFSSALALPLGDMHASL
jgi:hypothetical protein